MITFTKIVGRNINSFESFEFPILPGRHLIIGQNFSECADSNGAGKSTILESLIWVLFKNSPKGEDISRDWKGNAEGKVFFSQNGHDYEIRRYGKDKTYGNSVQIFQDGEDVSARLPSHTDAEIIRKLGMNYELATITIIILQGLPSNFSTLQPTSRKQIIENMLQFNIWDEIRDSVDSFLKATSVEREKKLKEFSEEREKLISINSKLETLRRMGQEQKEKVMEEIKAIKEELKPLIVRMIELQTEKEKLPSLNEAKSEVDSLRRKEFTYSRKASDLKALIDTKVCPTCGQDYPKNKIQQAMSELTKINTNIDMTISALSVEEKIKEKLEEIEKEEIKINSLKPSLEKQLSALAETLSRDETEAPELEREVNQLTILVNEMKDDLDEIGKNIGHLSYLSEILKPSSRFRALVLEQYLKYVNQVLEEVCKIVLDKKSVNLIVSGDKRGAGVDLVIFNRNVDQENKENRIPYKSLSGGEKRRVDIAIILAFQRFLLELHNISTNLLFFDEIMDPLDKKGIKIVLNCLDTFFPPEMSIYVISHKDDFKQMFDSTIQVVKENDISRILN